MKKIEILTILITLTLIALVGYGIGYDIGEHHGWMSGFDSCEIAYKGAKRPMIFYTLDPPIVYVWDEYAEEWIEVRLEEE